MGDEREIRIRREKGKGVFRALHTTELEAAGGARREALRVADEQLDRIARILPDAVNGGLSITEAARLTGLSRPTLYQLLGRYSDKPRDLRLAVMWGLLSPDTAWVDALAKHLGRPLGEIQPVIDDLLAHGWIEWNPDERRPRGAMDADDVTVAVADEADMEIPLGVTLDGMAALEQWRFDERQGVGAETAVPE